VTDPAWILTKNSVMGKVVELMAGLSETYKPLWAESMKRLQERAPHLLFPETSPKISRGENYKGLPWVILDYPRYFGREDIFAIRSMFWWGHTFSLTLHLKGKYKELFLPDIKRFSPELNAVDFMVSVSDDEWRHEHVPENYQPLWGNEDLTEERKFLKLSASLTLDHWDNAPERLETLFLVLTGTLF